MGAGVSAGETNDELIDNLIEADFIKTSLVERVFRAVDRGEYIIPDPHVNPYRDVAWKNWNFHISAPCIYSEVMEGLKVEPGLSFLNLGSGTGYLNTMVGLILGTHGVNHGVELHEDVIEYANKKLDDFKMHSGALDEYDFCEPKFIKGNCLSLASGSNLYDRVYCGAACPDEYLDFIRNLVKIGGVLIVPYNERLVEIKRTSESNWNLRSLLPVTFANLVTPVHGCEEEVHLLDIEPPTLQELCRATIRNILRKVIETENPTIVNRTVLHKPQKKKKVLKRDGNSHRTRNGANSLVISSRALREREERFDYFLFSVTRRRSMNSLENDLETSESDSGSVHEHEIPSSNITKETKVVIERPDLDSNSENEAEKNEDDDSDEEKLKLMHGVFVDILSTFGNTEQPVPEASTSAPQEDNDDGFIQASEDDFKTKLSELRNKRKKMVDDFSSDTGNETNNEEESSPKSGSPKFNRERDGLDRTLNKTSSSDDVEIETDSSDNDENVSDDEDSNGVDDTKKNRCKSGKYVNSKFRRVDPTNGTDGDEINDCDRSTRGIRVYKSPYSEHMKSRIKELPLPMILKKYLNFHREL